MDEDGSSNNDTSNPHQELGDQGDHQEHHGEEEDEVEAELAETMDGIEIDDMSQGEEEGEEEEELTDDSVQGFFKHQGPVYTVSLCGSSNPTLAVCGGGDDQAFLWNIETGEQHAHLSGHTDSVTCARFNRDGKLVATAGLDASVKIWNTENGQLVNTLEGPGEGLEWIAWHQRGNVLLAGSEDGIVWMWLATTGECMNTFIGHAGPATCGNFTPDGKLILTASEDATLRVWNPKTAQPKHIIQGFGFHDEGIICMAMHNEKPIVLTGSHDKTAKLSSYATAKVLADLRGHEGSVESVGFCNSYVSFHSYATSHLPLFPAIQPAFNCYGVDGQHH
jgi:WD40 repeat protein